MQKITFTKLGDYFIPPEYYPKPSKKVLPEWYKNHRPYVSEKPKEIIDGQITSTIKKCMPVFDVLTSGYTILTFQDISVTQNDGVTNFQTVTNAWSLEYHSSRQFQGHPHAGNLYGVPKWINPWSIKTPKGYSCLFINPVHNANSYTTIFEGIVDTDEYFNSVNFPFVLKDPKFEGIIPAGTPLVQVIPFKRDEWKMEEGNKKDLEEAAKNFGKLKSVFYEGYKRFFWSSKSFD